MRPRTRWIIALIITAITATIVNTEDAEAQSLRTWCNQNAEYLEHAPTIRDMFPEAPVMVRVSCCESMGNPRAISRTGDYGLGQVNWRSWGRYLRLLEIANQPRDLLDPWVGVVAMRVVYDNQGLRAWTPSRRCWS